MTKAGIALSAYNVSFRDDFSDAETERGVEMARALGAPVITSSSNVKTVARIEPVAARQKMLVGAHPPDIGVFTATNEDAVAFLTVHHDRIVTPYLKDRTRDQGANLAFETGDTPIVRVLKLLQANGWPIPANIEYEYKRGDSVEEVGKSLDDCRRALNS